MDTTDILVSKPMEARMDTKPLSPSTWLLFAVVVVIATAIFLLVAERS